jgi:hypothetical protein
MRAQVGSDSEVPRRSWCARDTVLDRDVGLTVLRGGEPRDVARATEMIDHVLSAGRFEHPDHARVLEALGTDHAGLGEDLLAVAAEFVNQAPEPPKLPTNSWINPPDHTEANAQ